MSAGITLAQAQARLDAWLTADAAVSLNQRYEIDTGTGRRLLQRADAAEIRANITYWNNLVIKLTAQQTRKGRTRYVVPQ
jgi:uncharacterized protein DUF6148